MELFKGRYVALMCLSFILAFYIPSPYKIVVMIAIGVITLSAFILSLCFKKNAAASFVLIMLCCIAFLIGALRSYFAIDLARNKALEHEGYNSVEMTVISEEGRDEHFSEYIVNITNIGEEKTDIRALTVMSFSMDLHSGDVVKARVKLIDPNEKLWGLTAYERVNDEKILLTSVIYDHEKINIVECGNTVTFWNTLVRKGGIEIIVNKIQSAIINVFDDTFGKDVSPLAKGFFMNDRSDLSVDIIRDFRRCGASHLMAVSGMHITILLGAIDRFLVNLFVDKKIRCSIISVLSIGLLIITGFSSSASRAVIMLWITYIHFIMADDEDAVTSLFFSVFVILMVSPYSYYDLGLWMSFLATLGIVSVYSLIDARIHKGRPRKWYLRILKKIGMVTVSVIIMTLVANLFVLPVSWSIFDEVSLASVPANILLSPVSTVFLAEISIALFLCQIPFLRGIVLNLMKATIELMLWIMRSISKWDHAIQPLNYEFADIIIPILIAIMIVCIVIKLKYKWLMIIPPAVAVFAFGICLAITHAQQPPKAIYVANGNEQMIVVSENGRSVLCDISCESSDMYYDSYYLSNECGGNKIDALILAHISKEQPQFIESIGRSTVVDKIWLPKPINNEELVVFEQIVKAAEKIEAEICVYNDSEVFETEEDITFYIDRESEGKTAALSIYRGKTAVHFADPDVTENYTMLKRLVDLGRFSIISSSCEDANNEGSITLNGNNVELLVFGSEKAYKTETIKSGNIPVYVNKEKYKTWNIAFSLE